MKYYALCHMLNSGLLEYIPVVCPPDSTFEQVEGHVKLLTLVNRDIVTVIWISDQNEIAALKKNLNEIA